MLAQAQLPIEDLLGQISKGFIERLMLLWASQVAAAKHPGRHVGDVRWHGTQAGQVNIGKAKLKVQRPRLRGSEGEVGIPAYQALPADQRLSQRVADILTCGISTRKTSAQYRHADWKATPEPLPTRAMTLQAV